MPQIFQLRMKTMKGIVSFGIEFLCIINEWIIFNFESHNINLEIFKTNLVITGYKLMDQARQKPRQVSIIKQIRELSIIKQCYILIKQIRGNIFLFLVLIYFILKTNMCLHIQMYIFIYYILYFFLGNLIFTP